MSPNDLWIARTGICIFTDPLYKRDYWKRDRRPNNRGICVLLRREIEEGDACRHGSEAAERNHWHPRTGRRFTSQNIAARKTYSYSVKPDGSLETKTLFCEMGSDGMTIDTGGQRLSHGRGVTVFDKPERN